jgi:hypothetical protein
MPFQNSIIDLASSSSSNEFLLFSFAEQHQGSSLLQHWQSSCTWNALAWPYNQWFCIGHRASLEWWQWARRAPSPWWIGDVFFALHLVRVGSIGSILSQWKQHQPGITAWLTDPIFRFFFNSHFCYLTCKLPPGQDQDWPQTFHHQKRRPLKARATSSLFNHCRGELGKKEMQLWDRVNRPSWRMSLHHRQGKMGVTSLQCRWRVSAGSVPLWFMGSQFSRASPLHQHC